VTDLALHYTVLNNVERKLGHVLERVPDPSGKVERWFVDAVLDADGAVVEPGRWEHAVPTVTRFEKAEWRLTHELSPGFSSRTPGNGGPGGGKGATVTVLGRRRRLVELGDGNRVLQYGDDSTEAGTAYTAPERAALGDQTEEVTVLEELRGSPLRVLGHTLQWARSIGLDVELPIRTPVERLTWCHTVVSGVLATPAYVERCTLGRCLDVERPVKDLAFLVRRWGYDAGEPKGVKREQELATDLTERWCRSCLRIGERVARHRGELCKWCYEFNASEQFLPPVELVAVHHTFINGRRREVTEAQREPYRRAHREKQKKGVRGRRAGR